MEDIQNILEKILYYLLMLILIFLVLGGVRTTIGDLGFWIELLIVLVVAISYPPLVQRLPVAPDSWKRTDRQ